MNNPACIPLEDNNIVFKDNTDGITEAENTSKELFGGNAALCVLKRSIRTMLALNYKD